MVGGSREERQGLTGAGGGALNGQRYDLEDPEEADDDEELAFATAKFARD